MATEEITGRERRPGASGKGPVRGQLIGRFIVVDTLGAGGMGVVLLGYDPSLDRRVAIKLLHPDLRDGDAGDRRTERLLREARAMAQIAHRNVLAVYEVGTFEGQVFIAMEHIEGETLARWLVKPRSRREILDKFIPAARGLAAAHALGLVHRDFKPDNVLVAKDGRVMVADFGLVSISSPSSAAENLKDSWTGSPENTAP